MIEKLNERARIVLQQVVEAYVKTGSPIGSRTISQLSDLSLSAASIRNVMADLEDLGLLYSPHTSAGRLPTEQGLRLFVDGLLEVGNLSSEDRNDIETKCAVAGRSVNQVLEEASSLLGGLSNCAGLVLAPKSEENLRHVEFVRLGPRNALVVMVFDNGSVENRIIDLPIGLPASSLIEASNYLSAKFIGRNLAQAATDVALEIKTQRAEIDTLSQKVVEAGLATWSGDSEDGVLIVRGQAKLLKDVTALDELEKIRALFEALETKEALLRLIEAADSAEGVQIFIGAENELFSLAGCSMVIAPYKNRNEAIIGAIGVVGPTRINYARVIPMVDYTAKIVSRLIG